ncbi:hypothetical protein Tco_0329132 [Tanacetum coccineum]
MEEKGDVLDAKAEAFLADVDCTAPYDQPQALTTTKCFKPIHEDAYDSDVDECPLIMCNRFQWPTYLSSTSATNNPVNEGLHSMTIKSFDNVIICFRRCTGKKFKTPIELFSREQAYWLPANERASQIVTQIVLEVKPLMELAKLLCLKRAPRNHSSLPAKSANARRVEAHHRTLNKKNRVDSNLLVKHSVSVSNLRNVCGGCNKSLVFANHNDCLVMCDDSVKVKPNQTKHFKRKPKNEWKPIKNVGKPIKRVWKPISKPVVNRKPQWKPTGRHFSLFEKYPLTRIVEPTDMPIELPPSASSSPHITMVVQIVLWYLDSGCSRHMKRVIFTSLLAYKSLFNEVMVMASSVESSEFRDFERIGSK